MHKLLQLVLLGFTLHISGCRSSHFVLENMDVQPDRDNAKVVVQYNGKKVGPGNVVLQDYLFYGNEKLGSILMFRDNRPDLQIGGINDSLAHVSMYNHRGRLRLEFTLKHDSTAHGIARFYSGNGKLNIVALYVDGSYKHVLFYRSRRALQKFKKSDKHIQIRRQFVEVERPVL